MTNQNKIITVALVGNPNTGKTTLFNHLTKTHNSVGNYTRVTVASSHQTIRFKNTEIQFIDLPGLYSINPQSAEEKITRQFILDEKPDIVLNILDTCNLETNLYLSTQLYETGLPILYALNMIDESDNKGIKVNNQVFAEILNASVVEISAKNGQGIDQLLEKIIHFSSSIELTKHIVPYDEHLELAIERIQSLMLKLHPDTMQADESRWLAIKLLEGDSAVLEAEGDHQQLLQEVNLEITSINKQHDEDVSILFTHGRYGFVNGLMLETVSIKQSAEKMDTTQFIDKILLHRYFGVPIFMFMMWLMFEATFTLGQYPVDWIDASVGQFSALVENALPDMLFRDLLVNGIIAGVGGTLVFLPNILILFFFIALFSETGYVARSAFLVDRFMHIFGLHGKSLIPMVIGFGCNVPAIMACRTIEQPKDRLVSILINPYITCSARLPVFVLFSGAFFAESAGTVLFLIYLTSIAVTLSVAVFLSKTLIKGANKSSLIMELPPYRLPTLKSIFFHMGEKVISFLKKIGGVILVGTIIIWFLQAFPRNVPLSQDYDQQITQLQTQQGIEAQQKIKVLTFQKETETRHKRYIGQIGNFVSPVLSPLGFDLNTSIALLTGIVAKEVVVATFGVLHMQDESLNENSSGLRETLAKSLTPLAAVAFMIFTLLYIPCMSTIAALKHETQSWGWTIFSVVFSMSLAWGLAYLVTKIGNMVL
ncbi:MAG: ferrous iron transport protein B [Methylococcales bacterium]|jgi:ferrous iron transport protein B|nr:ferrous iron transport protein B [Methylococcales bacterium]MBT7408108.1 ferrous iron transport protein B [Methylococcales bacterium]